MARIVLCLWVALAYTTRLQAQVDFAREIRPILANHCWSCHGFDEASRGADLRLDRREHAVKPLRGDQSAIVPGNPAASLLVKRIEHEKLSKRMPPADFKRPLSEGQKDLLKRWIAEGAPYTEHWAFTAPQRPELPAVQDTTWPRNALDRFILAKLEKTGLKPSPPAARETLLRRVCLDLTGLPPTLEERKAFLADERPDAYEKLVDRLLSSPHYGEKMAIAWLDAARYADTNGYNNDEERTMWPWRDWVIQAFNRNLPYDQFISEQLAGDLLPNATRDQKLATGFNRNHVYTTEGGIIPEEYRVEYVADRVHTTTTALMGLSFQCARCHDHKYDPISQREFYRFFAFFNNAPDTFVTFNSKNPGAGEPVLRVLTAEAQQRKTALEARQSALAAAITAREEQASELCARWEQGLSQEARQKLRQTEGSVYLSFDDAAGTTVRDAQGTVRGNVQGRGHWAQGKRGQALDFDGKTQVDLGDLHAQDGGKPFAVSVWIYPTQGDAALLSRMDESDGLRGYDLLLEGGKLACHLIHRWPDDALKVVGKSALALDAWHHVALSYDGSRKASGLQLYVDGKLQSVDVAKDMLRGMIQVSQPLVLGKRGNLTLRGKLDELYLFSRKLDTAEVAKLADGQRLRSLSDILAEAPAQRSEPDRRQLHQYYLANVDAEYARLSGERAAVEKELSDLERGAALVMVMQENAKRRETYVLTRGQYDQRGDKVEPGVPAFLPPIPTGMPADRLGLARWLTDPSHPLTARVAVNRWWAAVFGTGLVETVEDFGLQGELPSHPELLDWLATEFVRSGWDIRAMQKLIVMSETYQQSSRVTPELLRVDPRNRLLARSPRYRLPAETVRDNALAISGLLGARVGGPSVKPYQPAGLWEDVSVQRRYKYVADKGDNQYRRGLYTFWRRTVAPPSMTTFDAPDRETCVARRGRTNTPLQALVLMNDPSYVEAARMLAERMMRIAPSEKERVRSAFLLAVAREPSTTEQRVLLDLYEQARQRYEGDRPAALKLLGTGDAPRDASLDVPQLAAWTLVASTILNLDETISRP